MRGGEKNGGTLNGSQMLKGGGGAAVIRVIPIRLLNEIKKINKRV